jgi:hypothetical protein
MQTAISYFTELTDPRVDRSKEHLMEEYALWGLYCKRPKRLTQERERYYEGIRKRKMEEYIRRNGNRIEGMRM